MTPMEPIPETSEAVDELDPSIDEGDLLAHLTRLAEDAQEIVPDLVGVSVAGLTHGLTFTLVATAIEIAVLDAVQYVATGPCVEGAHSNEVREFPRDDVLDEEEWRVFAGGAGAPRGGGTPTPPPPPGGGGPGAGGP